MSYLQLLIVQILQMCFIILSHQVKYAILNNIKTSFLNIMQNSLEGMVLLSFFFSSFYEYLDLG